ncbi:lysosomal acid lipase [Acrasis kona]|uniref:Lysosomal acid lipase n=1 Tax=Acrasis kona TaxID=1008807 RepID=A0AAW2ZN34_9EUKA
MLLPMLSGLSLNVVGIIAFLSFNLIAFAISVFVLFSPRLNLWLCIWNFVMDKLRYILYQKLRAKRREGLLTDIMIKEHKDIKLEVHQVTTDDGYHLVLQRFWCTRSGAAPKKAILMQHGLMENSSVYLLHGEQSIALRMARAGYEVWLGNNRSSLYGQMTLVEDHEGNVQMHEKVNESSFWNYSIDELVKYDFPAMTRKVKQISGLDKIDFIGMSQGAGQAMGSLSSDADMKDHFNSMILLSPACFLRKSPNGLLMQILLQIPESWFGVHEFMMVLSLAPLIMPDWIVGTCGYTIMKMSGFLKRPLGGAESYKTRAKWFKGVPLGCTSTVNLLHWLQVMRDGGVLTRFRTREKYNIEGMLNTWDKQDSSLHKPNVFVILGDDDCVIDHEASRAAFEERDSNNEVIVKTRKVHVANEFGHTDFLWADLENNSHIYDKIQKFLSCH